MKIIVISLVTLFFLFVALLTVKFWGKSQVYANYSHAMLEAGSDLAPLIYIRPSYENLKEVIAGDKNIYLDVTVTFDQKLVIPKRKWLATEKPARLFSYDEIKNDVILVTEIKDFLAYRKIIFNPNENAQAIHETFIHDIKLIGLEKGENFIVTSQYESPLKALKEIAPALVYGSTQPEILKIVAMQSLHLLEAVSLRADVIIHPLKIHKHNFFNDEILAEMKKRFKKIIVGPISADDMDQARTLKPFAIILNY